jgi:hypothetical protein
MLELISHQDGPTATWALIRALIGGIQPKQGWWAPSPSAINRRWEPLARVERFNATVHPPSVALPAPGCPTGDATASLLRHQHRRKIKLQPHGLHPLFPLFLSGSLCWMYPCVYPAWKRFSPTVLHLVILKNI